MAEVTQRAEQQQESQKTLVGTIISTPFQFLGVMFGSPETTTPRPAIPAFTSEPPRIAAGPPRHRAGPGVARARNTPEGRGVVARNRKTGAENLMKNAVSRKI